MSRIGRLAIPVPNGVTATVDGQKVSVKGPKGELSFVAGDDVSVALEDSEIAVKPRDPDFWQKGSQGLLNLLGTKTAACERYFGTCRAPVNCRLCKPTIMTAQGSAAQMERQGYATEGARHDSPTIVTL